MRAKYIVLLTVALAIFFPRIEKQGYSYQEFLWTSSWMKDQCPSQGFIFRYGEVDGALMWRRVRLGFPLGATTIDSRVSDSVIQGRIETSAILLNLIIVGLPVGSGLIAAWLIRIRGGGGRTPTEVDVSDPNVAWVELGNGIKCDFSKMRQMAASAKVGETVYVDGFLKRCNEGDILRRRK
jgi:hypothetical protein